MALLAVKYTTYTYWRLRSREFVNEFLCVEKFAKSASEHACPCEPPRRRVAANIMEVVVGK